MNVGRNRNPTYYNFMYCTKTDILHHISDEELAQLTSEQGDLIDEIVVNKSITDASSIIDSYIGQRFSVPLLIAPPRVNQLTITIAIYLMHSRRAARVGGINEVVRMNYEDAIRFLEQVAAGRASVGIDPPLKDATTAGGKYSANERIFTKNSMDNL